MINQTNQMILVSDFKGFTKPTGNVPLIQKLQEIAEGKYLTAIEKLRLLIRQEKYEEATRIKRQLPGFTLSATYNGRRVAECITGYNDILILDFDKLTEDVLIGCRELICRQPHTLFCTRSPSNNGLKAGVHLRSKEADRLRELHLNCPEITLDDLENYHKQMFELCTDHYQKLCGVAIDSSGSDIGRLCFMTYDPDIYINHQAIEDFEPQCPTITIPPEATASAKKKLTQRQIIRQELPGNRSVDISQIGSHFRMEYQDCVNHVGRTMRYEPGSRDTFIYTLGHTCYRRKFPQDLATQLTEHYYGGAPDIDIPSTIANAYHYTSRTDKQEAEAKKPISIRVLDKLSSMYEVRRNIVLESLEFRTLEPDGRPKAPFKPIQKEDYNTMFLNIGYAGITCQAHLISTVIDSCFARNYNPFEEYFYNLPPWDGQTDHIGRLTETMQTNDQEFWRDCFKRWIVGLVACALDDNRENQLALIIKGAQGKGKSTWIRHLLPPELKQYYRNGMLNPSDKDHMLMLSKRLLINLEEFEGMRNNDISELKRLIGQDTITERKAWGKETGFYIRRASFIASTNEPRFLEDITGTRRFPTVTAEAIDYQKPVNHAGVYSQAIHLWKSGFKYWYDDEEFQKLYAHNMQYVITSHEEELFYCFFRKPEPGDCNAQWMSVGIILSKLVIWGKIRLEKYTQRTMIKVVDKGGFRKRVTQDNITEYELVFIQSRVD